jgi:hypothetical protein
MTIETGIVPAKDTEIEAVSVAETATDIETGTVAATETGSTR